MTIGSLRYKRIDTKRYGSKIFNLLTRPPKTISVFGDTKLLTAQKKFGVTSAYFDGTGDYIISGYSNDYNFKDNPFTLECWAHVPTVNTTKTLISRQETGSNLAIQLRIVNNTAQIVLRAGTNETVYSATSAASIVANTWYHIAGVVNGTSLTIFLNGTGVTTTIPLLTTKDSTEPYTIGALNVSGTISALHTGYIDEVRISKGARYTANFTPATLPFFNDNNTLLLLHMNGYNNSTEIADDTVSIRSAKTLTPVGDVVNSTTQVIVGSGSIYFDGTGDYISLKSEPDLAFGTSDFTIETWFYANSVGASFFILDSRYDATARVLPTILYNFSNSSLTYFLSGADRIIHNPSLQTNTWNHFAIVRNNGVTKMYFNGVKVGSDFTDGNNYIQGNNWIIGARYTFVNNLNGYLDEFRISNVARYTANFTPTTIPFANDLNTLVLIHAEDNIGNNYFPDATGE